ncbi:MAG: gamma-glutamyltransferase [Deltaproteobacteria bacterium]|nr:gamma-glutamyltransferase [Deltaproteobacteria bacterium]
MRDPGRAVDVDVHVHVYVYGVVLLLALGSARVAHAAYPTPARGEEAMVVTARPEATRAALQILKAGGNAVDAAVCAALVLGVVEPYSSGIGGGGFLLLHRPGEEATVALDFREKAPAAATRDMYLKEGEVVPGLSREGWLSVATPGQVAGLLLALEKWGKLPRAKVMAPAIRLARQGFPVSPRYQHLAGKSLEKLRKDPEAARIFLTRGEDGAWQVPPLGHVVKQPDLARTLQRIAKQGSKGFYAGPVARAIEASAKEGGGILTAKDLAAYAPTERAPVVGRYRGFEIHSMPPPSSGGVILLELLQILEGHDPKARGWRSPATLHLMAEAMRRAFADRNTQLGDPAFVENPIDTLLDPSYAARQRASIDPAKASRSDQVKPLAPEGASGESGTHTSHLSVVDATGNAVALTTTVNYLFGAGVVAKGTGVLMNDEMDDFAAAPGAPNVFGLVQGEANAVAPNKIPLSSMSPTLVFEPGEGGRRLRWVVGSPGGPRIITTVLQVLIEVIDHGKDIQEAVSLPRLHHQWYPDRIFVEPGFEAATLEGLKALGHTLEEGEPWSAANCIEVDEAGVRHGGTDPRQEGLAEGY